MIGQSVFLPLLKNYPELANIATPAGKAGFKRVFLDALETETVLPQQFASHYFGNNT